jgi:hypothetical protein
MGGKGSVTGFHRLTALLSQRRGIFLIAASLRPECVARYANSAAQSCVHSTSGWRRLEEAYFLYAPQNRKRVVQAHRRRCAGTTGPHFH